MDDLGLGSDPSGVPVLDRLGARALRRAEPRASIALAGVGCAVAAVGAVVVGASSGSDGDDFDRWPGVAATLVLLVAGLLVQHHVRRGPLATASTIAVVLGLPPLLVFVTVDVDRLPDAPWSTEAVLVLSTLGWAVAYLAGPGRGRPAYLAAAAIGLWATVLQVTEKVFDLPFLVLRWLPFGFFGFGSAETRSSLDDDEPFPSGESTAEAFELTPAPELPSVVTVGVLSLLIALGYLLVSRRLDRRGYPGAGTPLLVAAFPAVVVGTQALGSDLGGVGRALLYLVVGGALALHGAAHGRRFTCWFGAALVGIGLLDLAEQMADGDTAGGAAMVAVGLGAVLVAHVLSGVAAEPDELAVTAPGAGPRPRDASTAPDPPAPEPPAPDA